MFFIIQGVKRGAIIAGGAGLLFFLYYQLRIIERKNRFRDYIFAIGSIIVLAYFGYDYYQSNEFLVNRMEALSEGSSSGRNIIYANIFNAWYESHNILNILFGFGFGSSLILSGTGNWAHNDWLEGLEGFGLIGVILYLLLFFAALQMIYKKNWSADNFFIVISSIYMVCQDPSLDELL